MVNYNILYLSYFFFDYDTNFSLCKVEKPTMLRIRRLGAKGYHPPPFLSSLYTYALFDPY